MILLPNIGLIMKQKGKGFQGIRQIEELSTKIQEVTSNVKITEKNEKTLCQTTARDARGIFR